MLSSEIPHSPKKHFNLRLPNKQFVFQTNKECDPQSTSILYSFPTLDEACDFNVAINVSGGN